MKETSDKNEDSSTKNLPIITPSKQDTPATNVHINKNNNKTTEKANNKTKNTKTNEEKSYKNNSTNLTNVVTSTGNDQDGNNYQNSEKCLEEEQKLSDDSSYDGSASHWRRLDMNNKSDEEFINDMCESNDNCIKSGDVASQSSLKGGKGGKSSNRNANDIDDDDLASDDKERRNSIQCKDEAGSLVHRKDYDDNNNNTGGNVDNAKSTNNTLKTKNDGKSTTNTTTCEQNSKEKCKDSDGSKTNALHQQYQINNHLNTSTSKINESTDGNHSSVAISDSKTNVQVENSKEGTVKYIESCLDEELKCKKEIQEDNDNEGSALVSTNQGDSMVSNHVDTSPRNGDYLFDDRIETNGD